MPNRDVAFGQTGALLMQNIPSVDTHLHYNLACFSDCFAFGVTKTLLFFTNILFGKRYGHRAVAVETIAAVPGMVGGAITHLRCLQRARNDNGWIRTLIEEAENERMHLMTFIQIAKPTLFERLFIATAMWLFYFGFFALYLISAKTAHRTVGYFEEEAVNSYTQFLQAIDEGRFANCAAPAIAKRYWSLPDDATLRNVVLAVRADEAHHRDVNHNFSSELSRKPVLPISPYPEHAEEIRDIM
jgi:ubiquinol oxidase